MDAMIYLSLFKLSSFLPFLHGDTTETHLFATYRPVMEHRRKQDQLLPNVRPWGTLVSIVARLVP